MVIELKAGKSLLRILFKPEDFCEMYFFDSGCEYYLGRDLSTIVLSRLISSCEKNISSAGYINGVNVAWVLSMPEVYASLYLEISESLNQMELRKIFFENTHGKLIGFLEVESSELFLWIESLKKMKTLKSL
jgi:hypothetical protein